MEQAYKQIMENYNLGFTTAFDTIMHLQALYRTAGISLLSLNGVEESSKELLKVITSHIEF